MNEKQHALLVQLGFNIRNHREKVFKETTAQFITRLERLAGSVFFEEQLVNMENGEGPCELALFAACAICMQVGNALAEVTHSRAALYLSATVLPPDIELEMKNHLDSGCAEVSQ